ncbi:GNAT family N-acetyltransferase [Rhizobiaceae bacterium BDR2-2]|uniref:GNAT family N-acetyltransferase n=1 Tax=Ectorhizobium quercum TaxID=2965071 RepID=A0AAE3SUJ7_9HYPH|nr:GNAT family N-acetyltransferase [Ectorhizobium quercum]MCX8997310.1 GNAT family N-acetyltransferase [Ectorhizobium quercum]
MDPGHLHALSMTVRWPYRADEWLFLRDCGHGRAALDEIDRVVATAMLFPYGDRPCGDGLATLGAVIVSPRFQRQGVAPWLIRQLVEASPARSYRLNATEVSRRLFSCLGFQPTGQRVYRNRGRVHCPADAAVLVRPARIGRLDVSRLAAVIEVDRKAFGASRGRLLQRLLTDNIGYGLFEGGRLKAFAIRRAIGRGHAIGPVVAESDEDAIAVVNRHFADLEGQLVRLDTPQESPSFNAALAQAGLVVVETLAAMSLGAVADMPGRFPQGQPRTFALASPALG